MELLFELLLTAAATLLVACLLAKLFSSTSSPAANHDRAVGPAEVIAGQGQEQEEERIDEVKADAAEPALDEGWVEVEGKAASSWVAVEEEGVPAATLAPELFLGTVLEDRKEEGEVGKATRDLTAASPREILGLDLEEGRTQEHGLAAEAALSEVLDAGLRKQEIQATEAVVVEQRQLVAEAPLAQVTDAAGLDEEEIEEQDVQVIPHKLATETVPDAVLDAVLEKKQQQEEEEEEEEEQGIDAYQHELAAEVAPREIPHEVARELAAEQSVEEVVDKNEEVQNKEEAQCELGPLDHQEKTVPEEELAVPNADDLNVSQQGSSNDKVAVQSPEKEATLLGMPEDEDMMASMEFEEWEGIERSEVEKRFGAAAAFAASDAGAAALSKLDSDVQLQLQGLLKVAIDGPCYDSAQPLTLRPSSRAKWVSWQKLGNMHPEIAMGKYMDLLSEFIPRWMGDKTSSTKKHEVDADSEGAALTMTSHTSDPQTFQGNEGSTSIDEGPLTGPPNPDKGQSPDISAE